MKKKVVFFIHTEYHLLITINEIIRAYDDLERFSVKMYLIGINHKRLRLNYNFDGIHADVHFLMENVDLDKEITYEQKKTVRKLLDSPPDIFCFFQEMDTLCILLVEAYRSTHTEVHLYQDGLKPYVKLKIHSLGLIKFTIKRNFWLFKNGYRYIDWLNPVYSNRYAYLRGIDKLFLTNPDGYDNWNKKDLARINILNLSELELHLSKVFRFNNSVIKDISILYLNQPMHYSGDIEVEFLKKLVKKFPEKKVTIKLHPLTKKELVRRYKAIPQIQLLELDVPAELIIMKLKNAMIVSVSSTSLLFYTPENSYFYIRNLFKKNIPRLKRYKLVGLPANHVKMVNHFDELSF